MGEESPQLLRIEVLGPLRAWRDGAPLELGPVKRQAVPAAMLLSRGAVVSHERLLDAVWGPEPPAGGRKVLATHVNSLRRALDPDGTPPAESVIRSGKGWYRFAVEGVRLDTVELDERGDAALRTAGSGDPATAADRLSAALDLFRGEPLAGLPDRSRGTNGSGGRSAGGRFGWRDSGAWSGWAGSTRSSTTSAGCRRLRRPTPTTSR
ncbi:hypothetical protein SUDANB176_03913 [Streptomyces sp. enrichment culture]